MQTVQINIQGMTCGGCANSIHRVLIDIQGVSKVTVHWQDGYAVVDFNSQQTNPNSLINAIEEAGFEATIS